MNEQCPKQLARLFRKTPVLRPHDLVGAGLEPRQLYMLADQGVLIRTSRGLYSLAENFASEKRSFLEARSSHAREFILKGAALFTLWEGFPHRRTRDVDFLGFGESSAERLCQMIEEIRRRSNQANAVERHLIGGTLATRIRPSWRRLLHDQENFYCPC